MTRECTWCGEVSYVRDLQQALSPACMVCRECWAWALYQGLARPHDLTAQGERIRRRIPWIADIGVQAGRRDKVVNGRPFVTRRTGVSAIKE